MRTAPWRLLLPALAIPLSMTLAACGNEITTTQFQAVGTYELTFINGDTLPAHIGESDDDQVDMLSGTIIAREDHTCEFHHTLRLTSLNDQSVRTDSVTERCQWQLIDVYFTATFEDGGWSTGQLFQQEIWFDRLFSGGEPLRFVYERKSEPQP